MFRVSLSLALLAAAALPAAAQPTPAPTPSPSVEPVAAPSTCAVDLVRVPDDVRPVIQEWVDAEPRCIVTLSVRVLPTEGGLYVLATEPSGRTRERIVPDALTAAVLIASWVADDGSVLATPAPTPAPDAVTPAPSAAPTPAPTPAVAPPGLIGAETGVLAASRGDRRKALGFGATINEDGAGVRLDLDVLTFRGIRLGAAASFFHSETGVIIDGGSWGDYGSLQANEATAMVQAAYQLRRGRYELRGAVGLGVTATTAEGTWYMGGSTHTSTLHALSPTGELTVTAGMWFGRWAARIGASAVVQPDRLQSGMLNWERDPVAPRIYAGAVRAW